MADPEETAQDLDAQARGRVAIQYRNSPRLLAFIDALIAPLQNIEDTLVSIPPLDDPAVATGVNLDVTAELVGQFRELINADIVDDAGLRILILARITRNNAHGTGPDLLNILSIVFEAPVIINDFGNMAIHYAIGRTVTADEKAILNSGAGGTILARPMGVRVDQEYFDPANFFGFSDQVGALPFGENNLAAPPGGVFGELF